MNPPRTMGHEIVGEVVAVGPDSKGAKVGDKAVVYPWIGCGKCWYCQTGSEHLCPTPRALGVNKDGGYADHVLVPHAKYLYPYGNLPVELACLYACSGITAFGAVKKAVGHDAGKPILVIGAGGVGLMGVRFAKSVLGREPIVADIDENKRKLALENGACAALDPRDKEARKQIMELTGGTGVGAAIDFVGAEASAQFGVRALGRGGRLVVVGLFGGTFSMPLPMFAFTGCQIMGSVTGSPAEMKEMMDLVTAGKVTPVPDHQAQARRGRRHAAGTAQGPDHGARRPGAVSQASRALVHAFETGALVAHQAVFAVPVDPILDVLGVSGGGDVGEGGGGVVSNGRGCVPLVSLGVDAVNTRRCFPRSFRATASRCW